MLNKSYNLDATQKKREEFQKRLRICVRVKNNLIVLLLIDLGRTRSGLINSKHQ